MPRSQRYILPGERVRVIAPHSEVCMHFRLAGLPVEVELLARTFDGVTYHSAQLYVDDKPFSSSITTGEAGIFDEGGRFYVYAIDPSVSVEAA